jgi:hypothetical protein
LAVCIVLILSGGLAAAATITVTPTAGATYSKDIDGDAPEVCAPLTRFDSIRHWLRLDRLCLKTVSCPKSSYSHLEFTLDYLKPLGRHIQSRAPPGIDNQSTIRQDASNYPGRIDKKRELLVLCGLPQVNLKCTER